MNVCVREREGFISPISNINITSIAPTAANWTFMTFLNDDYTMIYISQKFLFSVRQ